jgi:hypothetical protein
MLYAIRHHDCRHVAGIADGRTEAIAVAQEFNRAPDGNWVVHLLDSETEVHAAIHGLIHGIRCDSCEVSP